MRTMLRILGAALMLFVLVSFNASATCPNGATFTQGGWISWTPTVNNMTGVTIELAQYQVDPYCNVTVVLAFKGTANGSLYTTFTMPFGSTLPFQVIPAVYLCLAGPCPTSPTGGGNALTYPYSNPNTQWGVTPFNTAVPASGAFLEYRISGTYR